MMNETTDKPWVHYAVAAGVATLTLDSPHNRNALSTRLVQELLAGFDAALADPTVRVVVLTHTGTTFCAGADLREASSSDPAVAAEQRTQALISVLRTIVAAPKPVIAQIAGHVRAGGMGIIAACDMAVAGLDSSFALTEVRIGMAPFMISLPLLARLSPRAASRYFLTGERFGAQTAREIGLVTVAADDPATEVSQLCAAIRRGAPQALAETKQLRNADLLARFDADAQRLAQRSAHFFGQDEAMEGMLAFLQKRAPSWAQ